MPYTPSAGAQATATLAGSNLAGLAAPVTNWQDAIAGGTLTPAAMIDAILSKTGYQAQNLALASGAATKNDTAFSDIGGGTPRFTPFTFTAPLTATYVVTVETQAYMTTAIGAVCYRLVNQIAGVDTNYEDESMRIFIATLSSERDKSFRVPVAMTAGANQLRLQWKVRDGGGEVANVNVSGMSTACFVKFTIAG